MNDQQQPSPQTILILGALGMLGHMLIRTMTGFHNVIGTTSQLTDHSGKIAALLPQQSLIPNVDAREFLKLEDLIRRIRPHVLINCVGVIKHKIQDKCTADVIDLNSVLPHRLAKLCAELNIRLIHFSTDCVFRGSPGLKRLSDEPDASDLYGASKMLGEVKCSGALTLRTSFIGRQLFGSEELIEWVISQRGRRVSGYKGAIYSGLTTRTLAEITKEVIERHSNLEGLFQIASSPISKFDLIEQLNQRLQLKLNIQEDFTVQIDRSLDGSKFTEATGIEVPSWNLMLDELSKDIWYHTSQRQ